MPSAVRASLPSLLAISPAVAHVATTIPASISHMRRSNSQAMRARDKLPDIRDQRRHDQQSRGLSRRHQQPEQADGHRRQAHAGDAFDRAGKNEDERRPDDRNQRVRHGQSLSAAGAQDNVPVL